MRKRTDSWCTSIQTREGHTVSGGAARNIRIAAMGGMDEIVTKVVKDTLRHATEAALVENHTKGSFGLSSQDNGMRH